MSTQATQSTTLRPVESTVNSQGSNESAAAEKRVVAIFRRDLAQAAALSNGFREAGIDAMSLESAEALRGLFGSGDVDLLVLDNELDGFFSGLEVVRKLRSTMIRVPAILLNRNSETGPIDPKSAGAVTVIDAATDDAAIVRLGLGILERQADEATGIPERARAIVERQSDLPVLSQLTLQLLQYLEMSPEQVPVNELCRLISIDPRLGILQDVGILALLRGFPKQYQAVLRRWRTIGQLRLPALEQAEFGCTHAEVSAAMMERWGMPASFIPAVLHHLKSQETAASLGIDLGLLRVMTIAETLADMIELPHPGRRHALNTVLAEYGAERSALCLRSLSRASAKASEAFQLLSLPLPSAEQLETIVRSTITNNLSAVAEEFASAAAAI